MCQKKDCFLSVCSCCSRCNCNYSCYDCYDVKTLPYSLMGREEHNSADIRHKFVCFPCRRVWKSYTNKYIWCAVNKPPHDLSNYVPNVCPNNLPKDEKEKRLQKYFSAYGGTAWGAKFYDYNPEEDNPWNKKPKCPKCGQEALSVGRNFKHCRNEKHWNELEEAVKSGKIDLQKDFRNYPREGKVSLFDLKFNETKEEKKANIQKFVDEFHANEIAKQNSL